MQNRAHAKVVPLLNDPAERAGWKHKQMLSSRARSNQQRNMGGKRKGGEEVTRRQQQRERKRCRACVCVCVCVVQPYLCSSQPQHMSR